jgi:hypothetical protein
VKKILWEIILLFATSSAFGQKNAERLTLIVSPAIVRLQADGETNASLSVIVTWNVSNKFNEHAWVVYPYFSTPTALSGRYKHTIPFSAFRVSVDGSTAIACNRTGIQGIFSNPLSNKANCSAIFYHDNSSLTFAGKGIPNSGSQTSTLKFSISGNPNADQYTGVLNFVAYVE